MLVCPLCNAHFEPGTKRCPSDGRRPLEASVIEAAQGDPLLGATVAERYVIVGRVGSGGMGTVYRAEQQGMGREVALKVLRKDLGRDPDTAARFHREARTLSQLKHPNTVTVFDFGQTSDRLLFLAMELLEGEMLSTRIKREGPLDVQLAIRTAVGVLRSLDEAHARGIVHRDLKPDNIFLAKVHGVLADDSESVKVVDFGIAKIRDGERGIDALQTQEGTVFGTPRYMSPEQAQGKPIDGRSDLYAVGVLLFHMLTGRPPFTDDDAVIVMAHHIKTVPPPVRQVAPNRPIPESLEKLVQRVLAKDPLKRPQTAAEFLALLDAAASDARLLAEGGAVVTTGPNKTPNRQRYIAAALVGVAVVSTLIGVATMRPPPREVQSTRAVTANRVASTGVREAPTRGSAESVVRAAAASLSGAEHVVPTTDDGAAALVSDASVVATSEADASVDPETEFDPPTAAAPHRGHRRIRHRSHTNTQHTSSTRQTNPASPVSRWND
ncbi:MAG: serine/threonine protein kinase [Myxococcales bacterium]|nr:serine/threonine protein kinase [Myxococcales bacterium]